MSTPVNYHESEAAKAASAHFNALPFEERQKLAPLLDHYRQMGLAEAFDYHEAARLRIQARIRGLRDDA